jgi:hypothetical protein
MILPSRSKKCTETRNQFSFAVLQFSEFITSEFITSAVTVVTPQCRPGLRCAACAAAEDTDQKASAASAP